MIVKLYMYVWETLRVGSDNVNKCRISRYMYMYMYLMVVINIRQIADYSVNGLCWYHHTAFKMQFLAPYIVSTVYWIYW